MAVRQATPSDGGNYSTVTLTATETVIGVRIAKTIPAGDFPGGTHSAGDEFGDVRVRPTNVTATIASASGDNDPDFILLHNGPNGGFTQQFKPGAAGTFRTNAVVTAVITDA